ncbi:MAG TPA: hypothetical protein V6D07_10640 [Trichocoleus sp.]
MRLGQVRLSLGDPVEIDQVTGQAVTNYLNNLTSKAEVADKATQQFHTQLNQGKCQEVYEQATEMFKSNTSKSDLINLCSVIKTTYGSIETAQQTDWWGSSAEQEGEYILARYITRLSKSTARETFVWLVKDDKAQLVNYEMYPQQSSSSSATSSDSSSRSAANF